MEEVMADVDVYDVLAAGETYQDRAGKKKRRYTVAGVAFDPKDGGPGMNGEVNKGVALTGSFIIRKRREKVATAGSFAAGDQGYEDDGADFLE
jgi:hypothetical protein